MIILRYVEKDLEQHHVVYNTSFSHNLKFFSRHFLKKWKTGEINFNKIFI